MKGFFKTPVYWMAFLVLFSCMIEETTPDEDKPLTPESARGVLVVNEGNFMYGNASLSYYDALSGDVLQDVFYRANGLPLGDVAQSVVIRDTLAYVVVNNSGRIYVMDHRNFEYVGKITGLVSPRNIHFVNDSKAYVTDLYDHSISIVDLSTLEVTGSIDVHNPSSSFPQHSTDEMVQWGKYVFVNCWSYDHHILVIDSETNEWVDVIEVLIQPVSMVLDKYDKLWVLTDGGFPGNPYGYEAPGLLRIDAASRTIEHSFRFDPGDSPTAMDINAGGDTLYFVNRHIYRHQVESVNMPELLIEHSSPVGQGQGYRGLGIDPFSSEIYVSDPIDHVQAGLVYRFSPDALPVDTFRVGIIPRDFGFLP